MTLHLERHARCTSPNYVADQRQEFGIVNEADKWCIVHCDTMASVNDALKWRWPIWMIELDEA